MGTRPVANEPRFEDLNAVDDLATPELIRLHERVDDPSLVVDDLPTARLALDDRADREDSNWRFDGHGVKKR